jgi:GR25 family glycosyltransferase involved in LPS biosynthesis
MKLAYTIVSIDESRGETKRAIRERMAFLPEVTAIEFVDGRDAAKLGPHLRGFEDVGGDLHDGELGVWFSQINCWRHLAGSDLEALIVLEDDAVVDPAIELALGSFLANVPAGWDFVTLNVPADQKQDYFYDRGFSSDGTWHFVSEKRHSLQSSPHNLGNPIMATAYQGYSCVAIVHSRAGARKLLQLVGKAIRDPVDCFIFKEHHKGNLRGYAPKPYIRDFVTHQEHGTIARATGLHKDRISVCRRPN